jgi:hypothetical protein
MKHALLTLLTIVFAASGLAARAQNLAILPTNPAVGQAFTVEFDHSHLRYDCAFAPVPMTYVFGDRILILVGKQCVEDASPEARHFSVAMSGLPAGRYSVYESLWLQSITEPPEIDHFLGNIVIGPDAGSTTTPAPVTSTVGLLVLSLAVCLLALVAFKVRKRNL